MKHATYAAHVRGDDVRVESFDGTPHVVAPVVAVRESILKGFYLPGDEVEAAAAAFNGVPLPVGHPMEDGEFVSANTPALVETRSVGRLFNVSTNVDDDGRRVLRGETWVDAEKSANLARTDPALGAPLARLAGFLDGDDADAVAEYIDALPEDSFAVSADGSADPERLEVSTAYWFDEDQSPGSLDGNAYAGVQRNLRPDHLALLPHEQGECSIGDGCGAPRVTSNGDGTNGANADTDGTGDRTMNNPTQPGDPESTGAISAAATAIGRFAHNCVCGCGGACYDIMDLETLSNDTGISLEVLEAMDEDERKALATLAEEKTETDPDGADGTEAGGSGTEQTDDNPDDETDETVTVDADSLDAVVEELQATKVELAEVREMAAAQANEEKRELVDAIEPNSSLDRETLEGMDKPVLEGLAADLNTPQADYGGRVAALGASTPGDRDDETTEKATALAAQLSGNTADDAGDDE